MYLRYQPPLFSWKDNFTEMPAVDEWFSVSEQVWESTYQWGRGWGSVMSAPPSSMHIPALCIINRTSDWMHATNNTHTLQKTLYFIHALQSICSVLCIKHVKPFVLCLLSSCDQCLHIDFLSCFA